MAREIELKFEVDAGHAENVRRCAALTEASPQRAEYRTIYYDTPRGALRKAGFTLRVRGSGGRFIQTVKRQDDVSAGLFDRSEWEMEAAGFEPDFEALRETPVFPLLTRKRRGMLRPFVQVDFSRTRWIADKNGSGVEIALDEGAAISGDGLAGLLEVELELLSGNPADLFREAERIAAEAPLRIGVLSKAERGARLAEGRLGKAAKAEPVALHPGMSVAEGFAAVAHACLRHYRLNEMVLLERRDPAALHQARVAMRRLRSSFSLFGTVVRDEECAHIREELRWFTGQLGDARNLDVFMKRLPRGRKKPRSGEAELRETLTGERDNAYGRALDAIRSDRLRRLMFGLVRWIEIGEWRAGPKAARPLVRLAARRLDSRWRKVAKNGEILSELDPESRHRLRIDIKKMRYACEFLVGLHEDRAEERKAFLAALEGLQDHLGELNDAETARELVSGLPLRSAEEEAFAVALIGREPDPDVCLAEAEKVFARLGAAGPYW